MSREGKTARSRRPPSGPPSAGREPDEAPKGVQVWESTLRTVTGLLRALEEDMKAEGFALSWYDVLIQLVQASDHRLRMQDLAKAVILSRSGLTRLIDRMEAAGLVRREPAPSDRRGAFAVLTGEGRAAYDRVARGHHDKIDERFSNRLTGAELQALQRIMRKLNAAT